MFRLPTARLSDSSSSEEEDFGESIFDPLVLDPEDLHSVFRVGSLMASANKAKQDAQSLDELMQATPRTNGRSDGGLDGWEDRRTRGETAGGHFAPQLRGSQGL